MKHLIYILILLFAFGCGSKKTVITGSASQTETIQVQADRTVHIDSTAHRQVKQVEQTQVNTEDYEQKIKIEFDTEKPLNKATNLPPVKNIEITAKGKKTAANTAKNAVLNDSTTYNTLSAELTDSKVEKHTKTALTEKSERKESQLFKWLAWISICAAVITAIIYGYKIIEKFKK
jgi:hypothetical protein